MQKYEYISVSLISSMFRDIGDLGLGILPGEGFKKIWASCLYILFYLFTSRSEQLDSLLIVSERNEVRLAKKQPVEIYTL